MRAQNQTIIKGWKHSYKGIDIVVLRRSHAQRIWVKGDV